jgi:hypothetical protein
MSQIKFIRICLKESFYREQKNYEKKVKMSEIKMYQVLPQGDLLQREERLQRSRTTTRNR